MPQESDASALIYLVWVVWMYWGIRCWLESPSTGDAANHGEAAAGLGIMARLTAIGPDMPGIETETATPQPASALTALVAEIRQTDRAFDLQDFLDNALAAYEAVVVAFATGDRETLKMLLSDEVYAAFATAMSEREARGETTETVFSRLDTPVLSDSFLAEGQTMFSIRLGGELFSTTGGTTKQAKLCDEWVFARPQGSHDPVWLIVATRAAPPATTTTQERHA